MKANILLSVSLLFLHVQTYSCSHANDIEEICQQVVDPMHTNFCVQMLKENPKAQTATKEELAKMVLDLTLQCYRKTSKKIGKLKKERPHKKDEGYVPLRICDQSYKKAIDKLEQVPARYEKGGFAASSTQLSAGMDHITTCIDAFERAGTQSLLDEENEECLTLVMLTFKIMHMIEKS